MTLDVFGLYLFHALANFRRLWPKLCAFEPTTLDKSPQVVREPQFLGIGWSWRPKFQRHHEMDDIHAVGAAKWNVVCEDLVRVSKVDIYGPVKREVTSYAVIANA